MSKKPCLLCLGCMFLSMLDFGELIALGISANPLLDRVILGVLGVDDTKLVDITANQTLCFFP